MKNKTLHGAASYAAAARAGLVLALVVSLLAAAPAWAGKKTCLTGTDPSVAADAGQIAAVRALIEAACECTSFDGSSGKTHGKYVTCAGAVIAAQVGAGQLRTQCKGTVKKYYATSTCGVPASKGVVPCIKKTAKGTVTCAIKPGAKCTDTPGKYTQAACGAFRLCIDAADTSHDALIGPDDSGACAALPTATQTVPPGSTPTRTFTRQPGAPTLTPTPPGPTRTFTPGGCGSSGGQCGGSCPPGDTCQSNPLGLNPCVCQSCGGSGGQCGGSCAEAGATCVDLGVCGCIGAFTPTPVPQSPTPTHTPPGCGLSGGFCGGTCPTSGTTCQGVYDSSGTVGCVCATCGLSGSGQCGGSCAGAGTCTYVNLFNGGCLCLAPTPTVTPTPVCCGNIPGGQCTDSIPAFIASQASCESEGGTFYIGERCDCTVSALCFGSCVP